MPEQADSKRFYDEFVDYQEGVGVNERHRAILRGLLDHGLKPDHDVLEIGCGIGTLTDLLSDALEGRGLVMGLDLSPKSIEVAKSRLADRTNVSVVTADVLETELDRSFDVIVLPDVVEHIPLEHHHELFRRISTWLAPDGFVLLNYPNPYFLAWCHGHRPDLLQLIDQPIHADELLTNAAPHGLYLHFLETYSIWVDEGDYVLAVLRPSAAATQFTIVPESPGVLARVRAWLRARIP
jgi:trans-aconitate 2-methyltransferase